MKIVVLDAGTLGEDIDVGVLRVGEADSLTVWQSTTSEELADHASGAEVLVINKIKIGEAQLSMPELGRVKLICLVATGYDNVDVEACRHHGVGVANVRGYSTDSVAQVTVGMVLSLYNRLPQYNRYVADGSYTHSGCANALTPVYRELRGKTWGIVGLGRIGRQVAAVAEALGCRVIANKQTPDERIPCVDLDTLCRESDIITVHVPLTDKTRGCIDARRISLMKQGVIFVIMARGAVTDEAALAEAFKSGHIGGLGADVYSVEPFPAEHPFTAIAAEDGVCLTPHMSWGSYESRVRCLSEVAQNIRSFIGGDLRNRVDV